MAQTASGTKPTTSCYKDKKNIAAKNVDLKDHHHQLADHNQFGRFMTASEPFKQPADVSMLTPNHLNNNNANRESKLYRGEKEKAEEELKEKKNSSCNSHRVSKVLRKTIITYGTLN